jgi:hypothetical protein
MFVLDEMAMSCVFLLMHMGVSPKHSTEIVQNPVPLILVGRSAMRCAFVRCKRSTFYSTEWWAWAT